ncbi:adaptor protein MecA [Vagococcus elongatus]|uniref:Adapter protein MecA n=1 Tax=Vagococcus elongatus TaxID=180344 RepID=A0A430AMX1_9ENTE|nr:adaptor protein MecA [Vagococcus elongatus]RSU09468.1 adaptor protein MecA [Vagococcus elongatus]
MEMERINENTIRVLIENADLEERGITFLDLLGNHKQIENFFYSILEEVDIDEQFQETDAVTFQVLPNRNGLELFISKNALMGENGETADMPDIVDQESLSEFVRRQMVEGTPVEQLPKENEAINQIDSPTIDYVVVFEDFEDLIELAKISKFNNMQTHLYRMDEFYFLHSVFFLEETSENQVKEDIAKVLEYSHLSKITPEILAEHGDSIMEYNALEQVKYYF